MNFAYSPNTRIDPEKPRQKRHKKTYKKETKKNPVQFHTISMPDGTIRKGIHDWSGEAGKRFLLPLNLKNKKVIDFGTWNGYWAIESKKRGAIVVASDEFRRKLSDPLDAYNIPFYASGNLDNPLPKSFPSGFDIVLYFGILYHQKNPIQGLMNASRCCKKNGKIIIETAVNNGGVRKCPDNIPLLWLSDGTFAKDPTTYCVPNLAGLMLMCKQAGLNVSPIPFGWDKTKTRVTVVCNKNNS